MARVTAIYKPGDYPGNPDEKTQRDLADLFGSLFPNNPDPEIDKSHDGIAIAAHNPTLALHLSKLGGVIVLELPWSQRTDLRELAIQAVNAHFKSDYAFRTRLSIAEAAGVNVELQNAISSWQDSDLFNNEQRLVIEYAKAVVAGDVPDDFFDRVVGKYGDKGAVEFTSVVAFFAFWAMMLNATRPE